MVCRRCECAGHVAVNCPLDARRSPRRKKIRVRPRVSTEADKLSSEQRLKPQVSASDSTGHSQPTYAKISIPVPPEASSLRDELESVGILSLRTGQISESVLQDVIPSVLNVPLSGPLTPINDDVYLIPLATKEEVKAACLLGVFELSSKQGLCSMSISPWTAELGALGKASGSGQWVHIWNVPLHGWCESVISEILKPVGDLVAVSKMSHPNKSFISVLVRRRLEVSLPMEVELSFGIRC